MKWQYCSKLSIAIGLTLISYSSISAQTIYGLDQSRQFKSNRSGDFYIQLGSFSNKSNALRAEAQVKRKSNHPVLLKRKNGYYVVLLGPFHSATEVRATAQKFAVTPSVTRVKQKIAYADMPVTQNYNNAAPVSPTHAPSIYKDKDGVEPENHWFIGIGGGWIAPFGTDATNFASSGMPGFPNDRYVNNGSSSAGQISGFAGYQWQRPNIYFPAISLSFEYAYTFPLSINGDIFVNDLPDAKNFTYKYDISQQIAMARLKLDLYQWKQFMPYISGGLGASVNRVSNYSDSPIPGATVMHRRYGFNSVSTTQFAGSLGAGLDYWLNYKSQISLGYELTYNGKAKTGYGQGILSADRLESSLNSNAVVIKGTYFIN